MLVVLVFENSHLMLHYTSLIVNIHQVWESSTRTINVCEGLDWLSSFALFLRFLPPSSPLDQAVVMFQQAFESGK